MPLPANRVDTVRVPNDTTTYDIVPSSLQDGSGKHSIATPTTTKDTTLVVGVKVNNVMKEPTNGIVDLGTFQDGLDSDQLAAVNSGITADKVTKYEGYETKINSNTSEIGVIKDALKSGVTFKGKITDPTLPAATDYNNGDLIIFGEKEYICFDNGTSKEWIELGDEGTHLTKAMADTYYVKKLGTGTDYRVYMVSPDGTDTSRVVSSSAVSGAVPLRTSAGQLTLPDQSTSAPAANNAISQSYADGRYQYQMDRKTTDFHSVTTLRWLDANNNNEMVLNGNVLLYNNGKLTASFYPEYLRYKTDNVYWSELVDLVSNKAPLLNGDKGAIGSYTSAGNGVSSVTTFAGEDISNTAKGINSFSLGRLNAVEGAGCLAYGNKNTVKGVGAIALGGGNVSGDRIDWTSASASVNNSSAYCISLGENNTTTGRSAVSIGVSNKSNGDGSISVGRDNTVWSKESVAIGRSNTLNKVSTGSYDEQEPDQGNGVVAIGTGLKTPLRYRDLDYSNNFYWNCVISGRYNDPYAYNCVRSSDLVYASSLPPLFTLGNGLSDTSRNNAIVLFHNASAVNSDFIYFNEYSIFNKKCEFRGPETIIEGTLKDASGAQYIKGGTITTSFINSLF